MKPVIHAIAGTTAMLTIAIFWISTLVSELFLDQAAVTAVKRAIVVYGLVVLVCTLALTGGSGFVLGKTHKGRLVQQKKSRMRFIMMNGLLVLLPSALYLYSKSTVAEFDTLFYMVQMLELLAGLAQFVLMSRNFRDGLRLAQKFHSRPD